MNTAVWWLALGLLWPHAPSTAWAESFDLSKSSVPREEILSGGPPKDGIPALIDPAIVPADRADHLEPDDRVLGVEMHGEARAYPVRILNWHEVVNDRLGGVPIVMSYCPLTGSGIAFRAERHGQRVAFGVSGLLYNSNLVLYDRQTDSLWSQVKMEAIAGPRLGERLEPLPVAHSTWAAWQAEHPTSEVLTLDTGYQRDYDHDPYAGYEATERTMFPVQHRDARLSAKTWVLGVLVNGQAKAYPLDRLPTQSLEDEIGGLPIRINHDPAARSATATDAAGRPVQAVQAYWFAWAAFYPDTLLYGE